jgi:hypothetical protein
VKAIPSVRETKDNTGPQICLLVSYTTGVCVGVLLLELPFYLRVPLFALAVFLAHPGILILLPNTTPALILLINNTLRIIKSINILLLIIEILHKITIISTATLILTVKTLIKVTAINSLLLIIVILHKITIINSATLILTVKTLVTVRITHLATSILTVKALITVKTILTSHVLISTLPLRLPLSPVPPTTPLLSGGNPLQASYLQPTRTLNPSPSPVSFHRLLTKHLLTFLTSASAS